MVGGSFWREGQAAFSISIATITICKNAVQKISHFCRKTGGSANKNAAFANRFSLCLAFSMRKPLPRRNLHFFHAAGKNRAEKPTVGFLAQCLSAKISV
jgi:hypothetical protein